MPHLSLARRTFRAQISWALLVVAATAELATPGGVATSQPHDTFEGVSPAALLTHQLRFLFHGLAHGLCTLMNLLLLLLPPWPLPLL